jgi:hypothetical protein
MLIVLFESFWQPVGTYTTLLRLNSSQLLRVVLAIRKIQSGFVCVRACVRVVTVVGRVVTTRRWSS